MFSNVLKDHLIHYLGRTRITSNGWHTRNCPVCVHRGHRADTKYRLGIIFSESGDISVNCFNCFFKTKYVVGGMLSKSFVLFLTSLHVPDEVIRELKFQAYREKEAGDIFTEQSIKHDLTSSWEPVDFPDGTLSIMDWLEYGCSDSDFLNAAQYAMYRKLNLECVYWSSETKHDMSSRVIIPYYYRNTLVGYTGRYIYKIKGNKPSRYYSITPTNYIYNLDNQNAERKYCVLYEGVIDAMLMDGVSCLGASINKDQIELLNNLDKIIILCPDRDTAGKKLIDVAISNGWGVSFPKWKPNIKDAGMAVQEYGHLYTLRSIIDSVEYNKLKIHVSRKLDNYK